MIGALKRALPWWAKIGAKLALARLPVPGRAWQRLGLFSPGGMLEPAYAISVFEAHYDNAGRPPPGFAFLELGPGDSLASALVGRAYGAARAWLVDAGAYASDDMAAYRRLAEALAAARPGFDPAPFAAAPDLGALLAACGAVRFENGLAGLRRVPAESCDFAFSQAVLEHVPKGEFAETVSELHRILRPGGVASHQIDFRDHLGGGLRNLCFSESLWEAPWFARRSGFYTNRLRLSDMLAAFADAGFAVERLDARRFEAAPIERRALAAPFRDIGEDDLMTADAMVVLRKAGGADGG